jgi:hypothetical protein
MGAGVWAEGERGGQAEHMKRQHIVLVAVLVLTVGAIVADRIYIAGLESTFTKLERERVITSNKLATAKIVYENLNHVRDLVFRNMDFPGQHDTTSQETKLFEFITGCVNDLKLKLVSVTPLPPVTTDRITTYGYEMEMEGDFFKFGELCAKFENSRRIVSLESFDVALVSVTPVAGSPGNEGVKVKMKINTYRVKKV